MKEDAVTFASHIDGSKHVLSPERSIEIQADRIGADISMQLDQCVSWPAEEPAARAAMELSARWAARCASRCAWAAATAASACLIWRARCNPVPLATSC